MRGNSEIIAPNKYCADFLLILTATFKWSQNDAPADHCGLSTSVAPEMGRCNSALQDYSGSYYGSNYVSFGYSITTIVTRVVIFCGRV